MAYLAVDKDGTEYIYSDKPYREGDYYYRRYFEDDSIKLPAGSIKKLIGRELTWEDEPVEIK